MFTRRYQYKASLSEPDFMGVFVLSLAIASYAALCYNGIYRSIQGPSYPATMLMHTVSYTSPP